MNRQEDSQMTVYLVMAYDYEDVYVESVWSQRDAAYSRANNKNLSAKAQRGWNRDMHSYQVIDMIVDEKEIHSPV
jgi:hypothetical protein